MRRHITSSKSLKRLTIWLWKTIIFVFFNDTATTEIYTLSLHDALPIFTARQQVGHVETPGKVRVRRLRGRAGNLRTRTLRSEEHTSELQSQSNIVCRLLLEKKKKNLIQELAAIIRPIIEARKPRLKRSR